VSYYLSSPIIAYFRWLLLPSSLFYKLLFPATVRLLSAHFLLEKLPLFI
jgi:hypothetical protein